MKKYSVEIMSVCDGVTGSQTLLVLHRNGETKKILVDCGWDFELGQQEQRQITGNPDCVILTHAHTDHIACLPELCKTFDGPIYASKDTRCLIGPSLDDTLSIQRGVEKTQGIPCLYNEQDISKAISQIKIVEFNKRIEIEDNIYLTLIQNSHIPGSACVFLEIDLPDYSKPKEYEIPSLNFFFTGDLKTKDNPFLPDTVIPKHILEKPVYIISESTYGGEGRVREKVFKENIKKAVDEKKKIIIPVLSLGRAQQIMLELKRMKEEGVISRDFPIFVDGKLLFKYNNKYIHQLNIKEKLFEPENTTYVSKTTRVEVRESEKPSIIISSSGNASFGPSNEYVGRHIENSNAVIHFTSYQPEGTLGRRLIESERGDKIAINGSNRKMEAEILMTSEYSSHDEREDIVNLIKSFKNIKGILITHGEKDARQNLKEILENELREVQILNLNSRKFIRIDRLDCGNMKEINSKIKEGICKQKKYQNQ